jgi:glycine cleavage system P protein (glycine dehydrogenase) subunit 1
MLDAIGVQNVDELFQQIPSELQLGRDLNLPPAASELALQREMERLLDPGQSTIPTCFLGGGVYDHFIPAVVDEIAGRGEFYTAYTPYQSEASQGTLQAFYEYQTLICQLTGMEASNASLYDGGTAVSEAVFMAMRINRRRNVVIAGSVHPEYIQILQTYVAELDSQISIVEPTNGIVAASDVAAHVDSATAAVVIQQPNFFGCLENVEPIVQLTREAGAVSVLAFDSFSPGFLRSPADYGVDIAVAEGQPLGTPFQFGGPLLGIFTCRQQHVRKMPGRLIGVTTDRNGKACFVLNLQAREQHIRRDKATSNICTNQGLLALRTAVFLATVGRSGLQKAAELCHRKARYAAEQLTQIPGVQLAFDQPFFREFLLKTPLPARVILPQLSNAGFNVGPSPSAFVSDGTSEMDNAFLVALTEKRTRGEIDELTTAMRSIVANPA